MVVSACQKLYLFAAVATVERIINDESRGRLLRGQRPNLLADHCGTEQVEKLAPVGIGRIEKTVNGVLADFTPGSICLQVSKQVLPVKTRLKITRITTTGAIPHCLIMLLCFNSSAMR